MFFITCYNMCSVALLFACTCRSCGLDMIHCTKGDLLEQLNDDVELKRVLKDYV